jgi:thymidylate synthase ThyX
MNVYLNSITGIDDAIVSMYFSKRSWTREREEQIRTVVERVNDRKGKCLYRYDIDYSKWMQTLTKWGCTHITMLRYIDFSITVEGLHRAGQDDWDSHAKRYENRIMRSSTRLADFASGEVSDYYKDKIIPTDTALSELGVILPEELEHDGITYVKTVNGYIREDLKDSKDVKRGLYMLSIPSNFIFKVNLTEWSHVYKERCASGTAHPEVKQLCESIADQIESFQPYFNRELFQNIKN